MRTGFIIIIFQIVVGQLIAQTHTDILKKEFTFQKPDKNNTLMVANINGSIKVMGYKGDKIQIEAEKTINNKSGQNKEMINVGYMDLGDTLILYIDGLCSTFGKITNGHSKRRTGQWGYDGRSCRDAQGWSRQDHADYLINFTIRVPESINLHLSTINKGDITAEGVNGAVEADNINGNIQLRQLTGRTNAHTINGDLNVDYKVSPSQNSRYYTLNGNINANFPPGLAANLSFKSFNGDFYTNIDRLENLPLTVEQVEARQGIKYKINGNRYKVGAGGVSLDFETFNGNVYLKEMKN